MKSQKSQQRRQELRLRIFGFSYLRGRDLSLEKIRHAVKDCVIENRGGNYFGKIVFYGRVITPEDLFLNIFVIIVCVTARAVLRSASMVPSARDVASAG